MRKGQTEKMSFKVFTHFFLHVFNFFSQKKKLDPINCDVNKSVACDWILIGFWSYLSKLVKILLFVTRGLGGVKRVAEILKKFVFLKSDPVIL